MQYEFLKNFPKRMKNVGLYAVLIQNSIQKTSWKQFGFSKFDEQMNLIFAVMLYIMEQSLKEENCTMDDIGAYIDTINSRYLHKEISYEDSRKLGDFVVNVILSNEGRAMYFDGYDFDQNAYHIMHISYVANRIVYLDQEVRRTSYYLTDDGYNLILSTLEIENNMKLTIHEMIFQMHLEKQSYDKAVDEIKNVFNLMRIQLQKIQEAMGKIRRNALNYSVKDYEEILLENLDTISDTKEKFQKYRELVRSRVKKLEEENINVRRLGEKEEENLENLRIIESYLNRTIDEHQKILSSHFDLKALYTRELELLSQVSLIRRFSFRNEFYDKVLENPAALENLEYFLRPLFNREPGKIYNLNKALLYEKPSTRNEEEDTEEILDFDEETYRKEQEEKHKKKMKQYENSLEILLEQAASEGEISLLNLQNKIQKDEKTSEEIQKQLIPSVEIFKEIMVELIRNKEIDIEKIKKERSEFIQEQTEDFQLSEMLLKLSEDRFTDQKINKIEVYRIEDGNTVTFDNVPTEMGETKSIRCSNILIRIVRNEE
ncbi:hypothetical protein [Blautia sp. MSJ-19]|uniref:hypothetical protein n=1 Tax=Blautia sp. MSJ-19 TaxID=2841517 RepID=UPI001C0ED933|nr:hypothetical protein [Blautia sp. MSJ-19]MBU5482516.1 hypothetical protein [Blautia sp. MSJ-19]